MKYFRQSMAQVQSFIDSLDRNTRVTIAAVLIAGSLVTFIVVQYAATPEQVVISGFTSAPADRVRGVLVSHGIKVSHKDGQLVVSQEDHQQALSVLQQNELMKADTSGAWKEYLAGQNMWDSRTADQKKYLVALQSVLGAQIAMNPDVKSAAVTISSREQKGLGTSYMRRSASVMVTMEDGKRVSKRLAHAVANAVSGAVTPMTPQDVTVIDIKFGKHWTIRGELEDMADDMMERVVKHEQIVREKVERMLYYIPNVIVVANVQIDNVASQRERDYQLAESQPLREKHSEEETSRDVRTAGEGGVRPNTGLDIAGGGGAGTTMSREMTRESFNDFPVTTVSDRTVIGGWLKQVNVAVNVPRSFLVAEFMRGKPEDTPPPDDAALAQIEAAQIKKIEQQVEPIVTAESPGVVTATIIPDSMNLLGDIEGGEAAGGIVGSIVSTGWGRSLGMALLALVPLGFMLMMVRKATQNPTLPSVEELAGVPPTLPVDDDLVGEADADEDMMAGVEVNEEDLRYRKIAEQISEMIKTSPDEAGSLIGRWVGTDD